LTGNGKLWSLANGHFQIPVFYIQVFLVIVNLSVAQNLFAFRITTITSTSIMAEMKRVLIYGGKTGWIGGLMADLIKKQGMSCWKCSYS